MLLNILFTDIIQQSIRHNGRRPRDPFLGHLLRVINRHKCSMFYGIKSGVNAHLDPRIGSRMHSAFDSPSMTFIHRRVELFLGQLRRMGPVRRQYLHPFRPVTDLLTDLLTYLPGTVYLLHLFPGMPSGHTDPRIRVSNPRNSDKSLLSGELQILTYSMGRRHIPYRCDPPLECRLGVLKGVKHN